MSGAEVLRARHDELVGRLRSAAAAHGHDAGRLRVVGVTKTRSVELVRAAVDAGITRLGENRVQEAEPKIAVAPEAEWHFIGRLQANKVRRVVRGFEWVHSVDSAQLLARVDDIARDEGRRPSVLLQVNVTGEPTKAGMPPASLDAIVPPAHAELVGLMTIAPLGVGDDAARATFGQLRQLRVRLADRIGLPLPELSMGMTDDAVAAAAEGATLVRIGRALFGERP